MTELIHLKKEPDLRKAWAHEALEFTPWLSNEKNLTELGKVIGINLLLEETESNVGDFMADIVCTEEGTDRIVVIENQLEPTNHDHLGKIITYAAGKDAKAIIWIVSKARDEHAKAIQWLNEHTDIDFFLVEIELWIIGNNIYAPHFNIIEQPIDWPKKPEKELSTAGQLQLDFWRHFTKTVSSFQEFSSSGINLRKPQPMPFYDLSTGRSDIRISLLVSTWYKRVSVGIYIKDNFDLYKEFEAKKETIEETLKTTDINWNDTGKKDRTIRIYHSCDITNPKERDSAIRWLFSNALKMKSLVEKIC